MKQLTDEDINNMIGVTNESLQDKLVRQSVREQLHINSRFPKQETVTQTDTIDFHNHTEEESWQMLMDLATSGIKEATVITGASGILKPKFQQWATNSILSPYIESFIALNNGSFKVKFKKHIF